MAAVLGIIGSHRGSIRVNSRPNQGTTFRVMFPAMAELASPDLEMPAEAQSWHGEGVVLVVDDQAAVRNLARMILERAGLTVLTGDGAVVLSETDHPGGASAFKMSTTLR